MNKFDDLKEKGRDEVKPYAPGADMRMFVDYLSIAEQFVKDHPIYYDNNKVWWSWNSKLYRWEITDEINIINAIKKAFGSIGINYVKSDVQSQILNSLKLVGREYKLIPIKESWVQFRDTIVDLKTGEEFPAEPCYHITNPIPWRLGKEEDTPVIDKLLEEWVGELWKPTLYEILAYSLIPSYPLHRIFCLNGAGLNGKGTFLNLLARFVGYSNITSTELDLLTGSRFETAKLYKKLVCMMGETNFSVLKKTSILKRLTGQDVMGFELKGKNPFDDLNYAKIIIATNQLPITSDKTFGFYRRWLTVDFVNQFSEKRDVLAEIPLVEFENLGRKCLRVLGELLVRREFTNEGDIEERRARYEERSNPIKRFISGECVVNIDDSVEFWKFFESLTSFLNEVGYPSLTKISVSKLLKLEGFDIVTKNVEKGDGEWTSRRVIEGLRFKDKLEDYSVKKTHEKV